MRLPRPLLPAVLCAAVLSTSAAAVTVRAAGEEDTPVAVQYAALLQDALDALPPGATTGTADPRLDPVRAPLRLAQTLAPQPPVLAPVIDDLAHDPADLADARARLQALVDVLAEPPGSVEGDAGQAARALLRDVYGSPAFSALDSPPPRSFLDVLGDALRGALSRAGSALGRAGSVAVGLVAVALAGLLALRRLRSAPGGRTRRPRAEPLDGAVDPEAEWTAALAAAGRGDHREAVRRAFRSALLAAAERRRLPVDAAWTTRELLARAAGDADLLAALAPAAASFDRAWYSGTPVGAADWETARARCEAVRHLARRRLEVPPL